MSRKIKKNKWISFEEDLEIQFLVRPFSVLYLKSIPATSDISPDLMWEVFDGVVVDWKGFFDENEKPLPCTTENKRIIAEQFNDLLTFVFTQSLNEDTGVTGKEIKN